MSFPFSTPQSISIRLKSTLYNLFSRPQYISEFATPPNGPPVFDTEGIEETVGNIDKLLFDSGTSSGFVLVQES